jgi:hypothetical protein
MSFKPCGALLLAGLLAACSSTMEDMGSLYVAPGAYDFLKCPDIAKRSMEAAKREQQLTSLMDRANQDPMGPIVNALTYSSDLDRVRAQLALLRKTAVEKNCDNLVTQAEAPKAAQQPQHKQRTNSDLPALH